MKLKVLVICSGWGSWIKPFIEVMSAENDLEMHVLNISSDEINEQGHFTSYVLSLSAKEKQGAMSQSTFEKYRRIIDEVTPDIIHIYGTENNMGMIAHYIQNIPIVISIQGLLSDIGHFRESFLHYDEIRRFRSLKNYLGKGGFVTDKQIKNNGETEKQIIKSNNYFIGRTNMDKNVLHFENKDAKYFVGEELLRPPFYQEEGAWRKENVENHSIFMPSGFNPIKGMHVALEALYHLRKDYPDVKLYIPGLNPKYIFAGCLWRYTRGEMYSNYLRGMIRKYQLEHNIVLTGRLSAEGMVECMLKCHVFLSPTVTDNSPNSIGEATMLGMPIVASYVGGVPSILKDEESCLFAPSGDPYMIAASIKRLFEDNDLTTNLSKNAILVAKKRHDQAIIREQYINIYRQIIEVFNK